MKYWILTILLCLTSLGYAQFQWGIQGGLNFSDQLDLSLTEVPDDFQDVSDQKTGWHAGIYGQVNFAVFRLRSELQYTSTEATINNEGLSIQTIDLPLTLGYKFLPPLSVFLGPVFQYQMVDDSFETFKVENLENEVKTGIHLGVRAYFKKVGINLRYERPLNSTEQRLVDLNNSDTFARFNSREDQWILGISIQLN